jgi:hypothetical protein
MLSLFFLPFVACLNNGVARTPLMGWLSWERFRCITDCVTYPNDCISEKLYMRMADHLVSDGFAAAGYEYVNVDDCWAELTRNSTTREMVPDRVRFPNGIDGLARYVHSKGLKLGLYTDIGTHTCGGYPGSFGHYDVDAKTFARWGIDSLKVDGCYTTAPQFPVLYPQFGAALAKTLRPIVYQCSWPAYIVGSANFTEIARFCNMWRAYDDIQDSSDSLFSIIRWWGQEPQMSQMISAAGPGSWNDADMVLVGDFAFSWSQAQMQFGVWAMIASPLMMSNDLGKIDKSMAAILLNREVISVNQDKRGTQGKMLTSLSSTKSIQWWTRPLANGDLAVLALCVADDLGTFFQVNATLKQLGWPRNSANVRDLYAQTNLPQAVGVLTLTLAPSTSQMVRLS